MSELPNLTRQRLAELWSGEGEPATAVEIKELAERTDIQRRRAGEKTLRDEFAMAALPTFLALAANNKDAKANPIVSAYLIADKMLEVRK